MSHTESITVALDNFCGSNLIRKGIVFHPTSKTYLRAAGGSILICDLDEGFKQESLQQHDDMITCIELSPSGMYIASGQKGENSNVIIWDYAKRSVVYVFEEHDHFVQDITFSLDERILATLGGKEDGKLIFWDLSSGAIISSVKMPTGTSCIMHGGLSQEDPNVYIIVSGGDEGLVLWHLDPFSGTVFPHKFAAEVKRSISSLCISEEKDLIFASTLSGDFLIYSIKSMRLIQTVSVSAKALMSSILNCRGSEIAAANYDGKIRIYDLNCHEVVAEIHLDSGIVSMATSADKLEILAITQNGSVVRCNLNSLNCLVVSESHTKSITSVAFCKGVSDRFASSSLDGSIRIWDMSDGSMLTMANAIRGQDPSAAPLSLIFDSLLLSGWSDGKIIAYDVSNGSYIWHVENANIGGVTALTVANNGKFLLSGGMNGDVRLWDIRSRELVSHLKEHTSRVTCLLLSDDDTHAVSSSKDKSILQWNLRNEVIWLCYRVFTLLRYEYFLQKRIFCHSQRMGGVNDIILSWDENFIVSVGQEKRVTVWDVKKPEPPNKQLLNIGNNENRCVCRLVTSPEKRR